MVPELLARRAMRVLDIPILTFLNSFSQKSYFFDAAMVRFTEIDLLKGGLFVALVWWQWFRKDDRRTRRREILLCAVVAAVAAVFVARAMALVLPFSERPLRNPAL